MSGHWRKWQVLGLGLAGLLIGLVAIMAVLMAWLNTDAGRARIESMADAALRDAGLSLRIGGWAGRLPFGLDAASVELHGPEGIVLRITDLHADWQALPLLWGGVRIDVLEARSILLERWPVTSRDSVDAGSERSSVVPGAFPDVRVGRLALERVEVGDAILGQRAVWRVTGEVGSRVEDGRESYLDVSRIDDRSDRFLARFRYRPAGETYDLDASWEEAPGGALASLIAPESTEGIEVRLSGDGTLEAWRGRLSARAAGAVADLTFGLAIGDESRLTIAGQIDAVTLVPSRFAALGAGDLGLSASVLGREGHGVVRISDLRYKTAGVAVTARGSLDRRDGSLAGSIEIAQTNGGHLEELLAPVATSGLSASVTLAGSLDEPRIESAVHADSLGVAGVDAAGADLQISLHPEPVGSGEPPRFSIGASLKTREVGWSLTGMEKLIRGPAVATISGEVDGWERMSLASVVVELPDARLSGTVDVDLAGKTLRAPVQVAVTDLDALDPLTRLDLEGSAMLDVDLALPAFDGRVDIGVAGRTRDFSLGLPVVRSIVSPETELAASLALSPDSGLDISDIRVAGSRASVQGSVSFPAGYDRMEISATGSLPDAAVLSSELGIDLEGTAEAEAKLSGPIGNPRVDGTVSVQGIDLVAGRWNSIHGTYSLESLAEGANGPVGVAGEGPVGATRVEAWLGVGDGATELRDVRISAAGLAGDGRVRVPHTGAPLTGSFDLNAEDIGPAVAGFLGWEGAGSGSARLDLEAAGGEQDIRLAVTADQLRLLGAPNRPVAADRLDAQVHLIGWDGDLDAELTARNFSGPSGRFPLLNATARGMPADLSLHLDTQGRVLGAPATLIAGLDVRTEGPRRRITLTSLDGSLDGLPIESRMKATLTTTGGRLDLSGLDLRLGQGEIKAAGRLGAPDAVVEASISSLPMALLKLVNPGLSLTGELNARLDLHTASTGTEGTIDIDVDGVLPPHRRRMIPMRGSILGRLSSGQLAFEASAAVSGGAPVTVTGDLPLAIDLVAMRAGLTPEGRLRGRLDWSGDAFDILSLLPLEDHLVAGPMSASLDLSGTVSNPRVAGQVAIHDGRYEHLLAGTVLSPLEVLIEGDGESMRLVRLEAGDGGAGTLSGKGSLALDPESGFSLEASLTFENLTLLRRDEVTGRASGELRASGPLADLRVTGEVRTNEVEVGLANNLPPQVVELELTEAESSGTDANGGNGRQPGRVIDGALNVGISMPSRVFVRGLGLDSEWQGDLRVRGTLGQPGIVGRLESVRGVLMFFGRRFRLDDSSLIFTGGRKVDPELDVRSIHEGQQLTVYLALTGPISNPDLSLSSVPSVPEDEILARALFGKSAGQLTAVEAVQLAAAVSELTRRSSGPGVLARLREAVGVDVLRFGSVETSEGEQATTFEAGRYVTEGLYVGVETSTVEEGGAVSVEYEVSRRLRITTDIKQTGGQNVGIEYKRDY